jgi:hypothetical protein
MVTNLITVQHLMNLKYITSYLCVAFSWSVDSAQLYPGTGTHNASLSLSQIPTYTVTCLTAYELCSYSIHHIVCGDTDYCIHIFPFIYCCIINGVSALLTLSDPTSDLVRQYDFPVLLHVGRCLTRFLLRLFARCWSLSDVFPHVVQTLANR